MAHVARDSEATPERMKRLPAWARNHIADLTRERDEAERKYQDQFDSQEVTSISYGAFADGDAVWGVDTSGANYRFPEFDQSGDDDRVTLVNWKLIGLTVLPRKKD